MSQEKLDLSNGVKQHFNHVEYEEAVGNGNGLAHLGVHTIKPGDVSLSRPVSMSQHH
jgi:hypothetical protein